METTFGLPDLPRRHCAPSRTTGGQRFGSSTWSKSTSARNDDKDKSTVRSTHIYPGTCEPYRTSTAENAQTTHGLYPRPANKFHQAWPPIAFLDAGEILLKYSRLVLLLMHSKFKRLLRPVHFFSNIVACSSHFVAKWSFISIACILIPPSLLRLTRDKV